MARKKRKPVVIPGPPVTPAELAKILKLKPKDVARIDALVASIPELHDSSESIIRRYRAKMAAASAAS
jgi:hypothetical protein